MGVQPRGPPSCFLLFPRKERVGVPWAGAHCAGAGQGKAGLGELALPHGRLSSQPTLQLFSLLPAGKLSQRPARVPHPGSQAPGTAWASPNCPLGTFPSLSGWSGALLPSPPSSVGACL